MDGIYVDGGEVGCNWGGGGFERWKEVQEERMRKHEDTQVELLRLVKELARGKSKEVSGRESEAEGGGSSNTTNSNPPQDNQWRRLKIPIFSGDNAYGWVNKVERYFYVNSMPERERVQVVMVATEGHTLNWFQWSELRTGNTSWTSFRAAMIRRFQPIVAQNPYELLLGLHQTGIVGEYWEMFEMAAGLLRHSDEEVFRGIWLNGLQEDIRAELKLYRLETMVDSMDHAQLIEKKNWASGKRSPNARPKSRVQLKTSLAGKLITWDTGSRPNTHSDC